MGRGEIACYKQFLLSRQHFLPIWITFCHFHQIKNCCLQTFSIWKIPKFVVVERVKSDRVQFLSLCKLIITRQNFRLVRIESVCRQQNESDSDIKTCCLKPRKQCGERRKCCLPAFSPFPTMSSTLWRKNSAIWATFNLYHTTKF